jgi:hypothetical protein
MEMTTKHLVIFGAGILAGYLLVDYLRKQNPAVNPKDTKLTSTPTLSEPEKINLFERALTRYQGGAAPSDEMLKRFEQTRSEAKLKIQELGLLSEYEKYAKTKAFERVNSPNLP